MTNNESKLFLIYKDYVKNKSVYLPNIFPDNVQELTKFPTIIFRKTNDVDNVQSNSIDGIEYVDDYQFTIDIYSKDKSIEGTKISKKIIANELTEITKQFMRDYGLIRTSFSKGVMLDINIDRTVIIGECSINNWNNKIR